MKYFALIILLVTSIHVIAQQKKESFQQRS
ncbi:MAG: hypothetical protein JWO58_2372 [Chitinophagaceae bacterium]|nr:hypothetical protein [Chitinophagaceae bacterium]